jgi:hypothetical protein
MVLLAASAGARSPVRLPEPLPSSTIQLEDAAGNALPRFYQGGTHFVLGQPGERYSIRISNPSAERVEAVVSVDGRDAISGSVADYRTQRGYIVPPYGSIIVDGFRQSLSAVAAFRFADPADSYSARLGTPENVGIIGVALFAEKKRRPLPAPLTRAPAPRDRYEAERAPRSHAAPAAPAKPKSGAGAEARERSSRSVAPRGSVDNLGTEYGESRESSVVEVPFERRAKRPERLLTLRYDDEEGLTARGIALRPYVSQQEPRQPEAFPESRFAQPPP